MQSSELVDWGMMEEGRGNRGGGSDVWGGGCVWWQGGGRVWWMRIVGVALFLGDVALEPCPVEPEGLPPKCYDSWVDSWVGE